MKKTIEAALAQLDPDNKEHWTSTGLPRMDAVNAILNVGKTENLTEITRQEIQDAAPGFTKEVLLEMRKKNPIVAPPAEKQAEGTAPEAPAKGTKTEKASETEKANNTESKTETDETITENDELTTKPPIPAAPDQNIQDDVYRSLTEEINACAELRHRNEVRIAALHKENLESDKRADRLLKERDEKFPPKTPAQATREYLDAQLKMRAEKAEKMNPKSQLDRAMARSNSRGYGRPMIGRKV